MLVSSIIKKVFCYRLEEMIKRLISLVAVIAVLPATAFAQIGLPGLPALPGLPNLPRAELPDRPVKDVLPEALDKLSLPERVRVLEQARLERLKGFVRENRREVIADENGNPATKSIVVATGINPEGIEIARDAGFRLLESEEIPGLDLSFVRLTIPDDVSEVEAVKRLKQLLPAVDIDLDHYYLPTGNALAPAERSSAAEVSGTSVRVGVIDGGIGRSASLPAIHQRGFARGAPKANAHATAIASLIAGNAPQRSAVPGASLFVADVYGDGPQGGTSTAIARALGWMAERKVPVVVLSLVGPDNPLLRKAVKAAQGRGMLVVAAVGNDGPAAPPAYPASLRGVLAVTATDPAGRRLPEAGRALHIDFAAPGSGIKAHNLKGGMTEVRGTSFAAPLVAGRLAAHYPRQDISAIRSAVNSLIREARDLGKKGRDSTFGHGLICGECGAR